MARSDIGWVKHHRSLDSHWVGEDAISYALFMRLVAWANYEPTKKLIGLEVVEIKRGELLTSIRDLAKSLNVDRNSVSRRLELFVKEKMIELKPRHQGTIVTICNYERYQGCENDSETRARHQAATGPATEPALIKNIRKKEDKNNTTRSTLSPGVNEFIEYYFKLFKERYNAEPAMKGKELSAAKKLVKDWGIWQASTLLASYFQLGHDAWIHSHRFSLAVMNSKIHEVKLYADTGKYTSVEQAKHKSYAMLKKVF